MTLFIEFYGIWFLVFGFWCGSGVENSGHRLNFPPGVLDGPGVRNRSHAREAKVAGENQIIQPTFQLLVRTLIFNPELLTRAFEIVFIKSQKSKNYRW
jgi:hypothetical protein